MSKFRSLLKRDTLIRSLKKIVAEIPHLDLPAKIEAIYAFGGLLRDKERLHDFDLVVLYSVTPEQEMRWEVFSSNFSTIDIHNRNRHPLEELQEHFDPYINREVPLSKAIEDESLRMALLRKNVEPVWAGCFSWTRIYYPLMGLFYPDIETVIHKMLIGRKVRGIQASIKRHENFVKGNTWMVAKNFVLAWSPDRPDIASNLEHRTQNQKIKYLVSEIEHFLNSEIPRLKKEHAEARNNVADACEKAKIRLDVDSLGRRHIEIQLSGAESYDELRSKCETARSEMRRIIEETSVLTQLAWEIQRWMEVRDDPYFSDYTAEDYLALGVIRDYSKKIIEEEDVRKILRTLKLPENHVITMKRYGYRTSYILAKTEQERKALLEQVELEKKKSKYQKAIVKIVRGIDRQVRVFFEMTDEGKPKSLGIMVYRSVDEQDELEKQIIKNDFKNRGFEVKDQIWQICGEKQTILKGNETIQELQATAKEMMSGSIMEVP